MGWESIWGHEWRRKKKKIQLGVKLLFKMSFFNLIFFCSDANTQLCDHYVKQIQFSVWFFFSFSIKKISEDSKEMSLSALHECLSVLHPPEPASVYLPHYRTTCLLSEASSNTYIIVYKCNSILYNCKCAKHICSSSIFLLWKVYMNFYSSCSRSFSSMSVFGSFTANASEWS